MDCSGTSRPSAKSLPLPQRRDMKWETWKANGEKMKGLPSPKPLPSPVSCASNIPGRQRTGRGYTAAKLLFFPLERDWRPNPQGRARRSSWEDHSWGSDTFSRAPPWLRVPTPSSHTRGFSGMFTTSSFSLLQQTVGCVARLCIS